MTIIGFCCPRLRAAAPGRFDACSFLLRCIRLQTMNWVNVIAKYAMAVMLETAMNAVTDMVQSALGTSRLSRASPEGQPSIFLWLNSGLDSKFCHFIYIYFLKRYILHKEWSINLHPRLMFHPYLFGTTFSNQCYSTRKNAWCEKNWLVSDLFSDVCFPRPLLNNIELSYTALLSAQQIFVSMENGNAKSWDKRVRSDMGRLDNGLVAAFWGFRISIFKTFSTTTKDAILLDYY